MYAAVPRRPSAVNISGAMTYGYVPFGKISKQMGQILQQNNLKLLAA